VCKSESGKYLGRFKDGIFCNPIEYVLESDNPGAKPRELGLGGWLKLLEVEKKEDLQSLGFILIDVRAVKKEETKEVSWVEQVNQLLKEYWEVVEKE